MAKRCGCANEICACVITGGDGIIVSGAGTEKNPYVVESENLGMNLTVQDTATVDLVLTGSGSPVEPYLLKANAILGDTATTLDWRQAVIPAAAWAIPNALTLVPFTVSNGGNGITLDGSGRIVVAKQGVYHIVSTLTLNATAATNTWAIFQLVQRRAGTAIATREVVAFTDGTGKYDMAAVAGDFAANVGDTFEVLAQAQVAGVINLSASRSHLAGHRLAGPGADGANGAPGPAGPPGPSGITDLPVGAILPWPGLTAPTNYQFCDGKSYSATTYPVLANVLKNAAGTGYLYGGTVASGAFNVPNLNNRYPLGVDNTTGTPAFPLASHSDTRSHGHTIPGHTHGNTGVNNINEQLEAGRGNGVVVADAGHIHGTGAATPALSAASVTNNSMGPFLALNFIILMQAA